MEFYDVHEQTRFQITVSRPENMEDLSDAFISREELQDIIGPNFYYYGNEKRTFYMTSVISAEVKKWTDKLDASGRKTLLIEDEELLDVIKKGYLSDYTDGDSTYGRHGDRVCYARRYKRIKKKATQGDVRELWRMISGAFYTKFGCHPSHIPLYDRHLKMFLAFKKIVGWRRIRKQIYDKDTVKFYRQIWDNPEEFMT